MQEHSTSKSKNGWYEYRNYKNNNNQLIEVYKLTLFITFILIIKNYHVLVQKLLLQNYNVNVALITCLLYLKVKFTFHISSFTISNFLHMYDMHTHTLRKYNGSEFPIIHIQY